jgi:hypothetical protein
LLGGSGSVLTILGVVAQQLAYTLLGGPATCNEHRQGSNMSSSSNGTCIDSLICCLLYSGVPTLEFLSASFNFFRSF